MLMFMTSRLTGSIRRSAPQRLTLLFLLGALGTCAHAQTILYKCSSPNGVTLFTDRNGPGCTVLDQGTIIPAPAQHRSAAPATTARIATPAPADFPKVNTSQQRARDDDRREILNDELRSEEKKLGDLRREFNNGEPERVGGEKNYAKYQERVAQMRDNIGRAEKNVDALKREIANIR
jgi:hypothetical protein